MSKSRNYKWVALTVAAAAGLAVITAWAAAPFTTGPASPTTRATFDTPSSRPADSGFGGSGFGRSRSGESRSGRSRSGGSRSFGGDTDRTPLATVSTRSQPMSAAFDPVLYRSIFLKGRQTIGYPPGSRPDRGIIDPPPPRRPQAGMVLKGITIVGDEYDAMIEDTYQDPHRITVVHAGEVLAGGRVMSIGFDTLDYQDLGKLTHVEIGQTLDGNPAPPGDDAPPVVGNAPPPPDTAGPLGTTTGMSAEDILARMKKRRQMEMGGK